MNVKARDGKTYQVSSAPPGGEHRVELDGELVGTFVLLETETKTKSRSKKADDVLLIDIADRFVAQGGAPMGIA